MKLLRIASALLCAAIAASFASCSDRPSDAVTTDESGGDTTYCVAYIRDAALPALDGANNSASDEVRSFCDANSIEYLEYEVKVSDGDARAEAVARATDDGADLVVGVGYYFSRTVIDIQRDFPDTYFLVLGTEPPDADHGETLSERVHFSSPDMTEAGYLAGRVAAKYAKSPAFSSMMETDRALECFSGCVAGLSDGADGTTLLVSTAPGIGQMNDFYTTDEVSQRLYGAGSDVVIAFGAMIYPASVAAAKNGGEFIALCPDDGVDGANMLPSPVFDYAASAKANLTRFVSSGMKWSAKDAGVCSLEGVEDGALTLSPYDRLMDEIGDGPIYVAPADPHEDAPGDGVNYNYLVSIEG